MFQAIANFINSILALIENISKAAAFTSNPVGSIFGGENEELPTEDVPQWGTGGGGGGSWGRKQITIPERITARFADRNSAAWVNQIGPLGKGYHYGTDFGGPNGTPVFAPYALHVIRIGRYDDEGRKGDYVIGTLDDGTEYYSGHLTNVKVKGGEYVKAGQQIGEIGYYNHTHVQLRVNGTLTDFEAYEKAH